MILDLRQMPIFVINLPKDTRRREFMREQLDALGLEHRFVAGVKCDPQSIGVSLSRLKTLALPQARAPFLVLEDDTQLDLDGHPLQFEVPDDTDALYLGHSRYGLADKPDQYGLRWGRLDEVKYREFDEEYVQPLNMLSAHAIIYISEEYVRSAVDANHRALLNDDFPFPGDIAYAQMQERLKVLATRRPLCYQSAEYGGIEGATHPTFVEKAMG